MRWISEELVDLDSVQAALEEYERTVQRGLGRIAKLKMAAISALLEEARRRFFSALRQRERDRKLLLRFGSLDEDDRP